MRLHLIQAFDLYGTFLIFYNGALWNVHTVLDKHLVYVVLFWVKLSVGINLSFILVRLFQNDNKILYCVLST